MSTHLYGPPVYYPVTMACDPHSTHSMITRRPTRITKPVDRMELSTEASPTLSLTLTSIHSTLVDPHKHRTMEEEYEALLSNSIWDLVPWPKGPMSSPTSGSSSTKVDYFLGTTLIGSSGSSPSVPEWTTMRILAPW
jgi:hypothetical protein